MLPLRSPLARSLLAVRPARGICTLAQPTRRIAILPSAPITAVPRRVLVSPTFRALSTSLPRKEAEKTPVDEGAPKIYTFDQVKQISDNPSSKYLIVDVRDKSELDNSGVIPNSVNISIKEHLTPFMLPPEQFEETFGFSKPAKDTVLVFSCKAGVRSDNAARMALAAGYEVSSYKGGWLDWAKNTGGKTY
ncbi:hypothetical protein Dda_7791 [Drechslerella dactyloides]|uniref:Rhodanese domain-containing protein n=1 Tax=Drechslerella dactyloides TaxID=74499 RepID=A0AAD6IQW2_DREDA|nr:hypothetical protein Dda_7791 [Drechslerella dactyloides]